MISYDNLILYCVIMLHYGIVSDEMTLFCMICYDKIMYCINTILCHTITLAKKFDILIFSYHRLLKKTEVKSFRKELGTVSVNIFYPV